jgi:hypothetical protein
MRAINCIVHGIPLVSMTRGLSNSIYDGLTIREPRVNLRFLVFESPRANLPDEAFSRSTGGIGGKAPLTALHIALKNENGFATKLISKSNWTDMNLQDGAEILVVYWLVQKNRTKIVEIMIRQGISIHPPSSA